MNNNRPKFLDLRIIRLPAPAAVSILHRVSGALMFVALAPLLWLLQDSLHSKEADGGLADVVRQPAGKLLLLAVLWAFLHHLFAGIRFLVIDLDVGVKLAQARASSFGVLALSLALTALIGARLW